MHDQGFKIDLSETFPLLHSPPVVEAILHWQARAQYLPPKEDFSAIASEKLPGYGSIEPVHFQHLSVEAKLAEQDAAPVVTHQKELWHGFRLTSDDNCHVLQFTRDGVVFSRLEPYQDWETFTEAAKRVWSVFREIAQPVEIQRLGVRFINQIPVAVDSLGAVLKDPPTCPSNLTLGEFVYQSTFSVPNQPFRIRIIKLMQPAVVAQPKSAGLFLDCDVCTTRPISCDDDEVDGALTRMRWLKNKVFFGLLTQEAIESFMRSSP